VMGEDVRRLHPQRVEAEVTRDGVPVFTVRLFYDRREVPAVEDLAPLRLERAEHLLAARFFRTGLPGEAPLVEHVRFTVGRDPDILLNLDLGEGAK